MYEIGMEFLVPFQYEFFTRGIIVSLILGAVCGMLGVYVVLRGMSYIWTWIISCRFRWSCE